MTTPSAFLPGKPHGQSSLLGCHPWGHKTVGHDLAAKQQSDRRIWMNSVLIYLLSTHSQILATCRSPCPVCIYVWSLRGCRSSKESLRLVYLGSASQGLILLNWHHMNGVKIHFHKRERKPFAKLDFTCLAELWMKLPQFHSGWQS